MGDNRVDDTAALDVCCGDLCGSDDAASRLLRTKGVYKYVVVVEPLPGEDRFRFTNIDGPLFHSQLVHEGEQANFAGVIATTGDGRWMILNAHSDTLNIYGDEKCDAAVLSLFFERKAEVRPCP